MDLVLLVSPPPCLRSRQKIVTESTQQAHLRRLEADLHARRVLQRTLLHPRRIPLGRRKRVHADRAREPVGKWNQRHTVRPT